MMNGRCAGGEYGARDVRCHAAGRRRLTLPRPAVTFPGMTPWVQRLLIANVAMFFAMAVVPEIRAIASAWLAFYPPAALLRPWSFITYMVLHGGIGHLVFNMIALYFFGPRLESRIGSGHFIRMYLASGITGAALSMIVAPAPAGWPRCTRARAARSARSRT
jgi:membrane associated rhomboid family serine protease